MLEELHAALAAGDWTRALVHALEAWRETRAPALADVIDGIGARVVGPTPPTAHWLHEWWLERAFTYDSNVLGVLLATIRVRGESSDTTSAAVLARWSTRGPNPIVPFPDQYYYGHRNVHERLAALVEWPDDPRVSRALVDGIANPVMTWVDQRVRAVTTVVVDRLIALGDTRVVPALEQCIAEPRGASDRVRSYQIEAASRALDALARRKPTRDPGPLLAACVALAVPQPPSPAPSKVDIEALWREVAANPDDVGTRSVLGDALVEAGDLRGDLIVLQCNSREPNRPLRGAKRDRYDGRVKTLLRIKWNEWLGDLALLLVPRTSEFRCGMLEVAAIGHASTPPWAWIKARGHRELSAVHTVRPCFASAENFAQFVASLPRDPRALVVDSPLVLDELAKLRPQLATHTLECIVKQMSSVPAPMAAFGRVYGHPLVGWFERAGKLMPKLADLRFGTPLLPGVATELLSELLPELPRLVPGVRRISITRDTLSKVPFALADRAGANSLVVVA